MHLALYVTIWTTLTEILKNECDFNPQEMIKCDQITNLKLEKSKTGSACQKTTQMDQHSQHVLGAKQTKETEDMQNDHTRRLSSKHLQHFPEFSDNCKCRYCFNYCGDRYHIMSCKPYKLVKYNIFLIILTLWCANMFLHTGYSNELSIIVISCCLFVISLLFQ